MTTRSTYVWNGSSWDEIGVAVVSGATGHGVPTGGATGYALVKNSTTDYDTVWAAVGGSGRTFTTATYTTASLATNAYETGTLNMSAVYTVLNIVTDRAARVRLYVSTASRDADVARAIGTDPADDSGVLMDVVTTASTLDFQLSPVVDGWIASGVAIPITVTNLSSAHTVATTLTYSS